MANGDFSMLRISVIVAIAVGAILILPAGSMAQNDGGATAGSRNATSGVSPAPGTNSAGTAQSSGAGVNTAPGVTTGSSGRLGTGTASTPQLNGDAAINEENKTIDRKLNSICRGC
jgi:hypothetical protein